MARLLVHVEGQTEETFVNEVLRPYLLNRGYHLIDARIVGNARQRNRRGGIKSWQSVRKEIINHLKQDSGCFSTTMVDYYALPTDWPSQLDLRADVASKLSGSFNPKRFVPFVVMHEFEGLLFSDCTRFADAIYEPRLAASFQEIRDQFPTPEDINDSPMTAPSKRVLKLMPKYEKPLLGNLAAMAIGLDRIRKECPRFNQWIHQLESLPQGCHPPVTLPR